MWPCRNTVTQGLNNCSYSHAHIYILKRANRVSLQQPQRVFRMCNYPTANCSLYLKRQVSANPGLPFCRGALNPYKRCSDNTTSDQGSTYYSSLTTETPSFYLLQKYATCWQTGKSRESFQAQSNALWTKLIKWLGFHIIITQYLQFIF